MHHLGLRGFDALLSYGKVVRVDLDADEVSARLDTSDAGCAGTHKGIENGISQLAIDS